MITATLLQESGQGDSFRKPYRYTCNVCYRTLPESGQGQHQEIEFSLAPLLVKRGECEELLLPRQFKHLATYGSWS